MMTKTKIFTLILSLALLTQAFASCQTAQNETFSPSEAASQNASVTLPSEEASQGGTEVLPSEKPSENQDVSLPSEDASVALPSGTEALPSETPSQDITDTQSSENPTEDSPTLPQVMELDEYELFLYAQSVGGSSDYLDIPQYTGKSFHKIESYFNSTLAKEKTIVFNGRDISLWYRMSYKSDDYKDDYDVYGKASIRMRVNSTTGKIVYYKDDEFVPNREYVSDITPKSSEEEFLAYVKKLLWEVSGVSVDGWDMNIRTFIYHEDGSTETVQKFVNNSDVDPDFNARYRFDFSATIDGVSRCDDVSITITNVGEIRFLNAMVNENYAPFENVKIDRELLKEKTGFSGDLNKGTKYYCVANGTELWLEIAPTPPQGEIGRIYLVKLAEIVKNEKEPDEEIKEPSKDNSSPTEEATGEYRVPTIEKIPEKIPD